MTPCRLELLLAHSLYTGGVYIALFPGPAQLTVLKVMESWAGPGNKDIGLGMCVHLQAVSKLGHSNFYCSDELDAITVRKYTERLFLLLTMHEISSKLDHPAWS